MDAFLGELNDLFLQLFERTTDRETWLVTGVCALLALAFFNKFTEKLGNEARHLFKTSLVLVLGIALMAAAAAAIPLVVDKTTWITQSIAAGLALLILVIPLGMRMLKASYLTSLLIWLLTGLVVAAVLYIEPLAYDAVRSGSKSSSGLQRHRTEAEGVGKFFK